MPVVTFEAAGLNKEQKRQLVAEFTETAARITGLPKETIFVFLKENSADNVGVGGVLVSELPGKMVV
ncbi:MAG: 2-hydroxymuconate tautomerase family protein [Desulfovibrio sp.]|nr:2-hydroxymuconate tautomerase family protein [Desulfovibrio sp.]